MGTVFGLAHVLDGDCFYERQSKGVNIEKFLGFWSAHNTLIIELLIAIVLLSVIYLAFRTFFGNSQELENSSQSMGRLDSEEIQRTLQKIIETQSSNAGAATATSAANGSSGVDPAQLEKLKVEVQDREKTIQSLKDQMQQLTAAQGAAASNSAVSKELEEKLKGLEARLAEYEIISEDIADLSFYKEENTRLQKELTAAKSGGAAAPAPPAAAAAPAAPAQPAPVVNEPPPPAAVEPAPVVAAPAAPAPTPAPVEATTPPVVASAPPEAPASAPSAAPATPPPAAAPTAEIAMPDLGPVDDDLMKEFASAVEEQKAASAAKKAAASNSAKTEPAPAQQSQTPDNQNLMGEFENFMKKG